MTDLDLWLTERYALFQKKKSVINEFDIHHTPWNILNINSLDLKVEYPPFQLFLNENPKKAHYSKGVQVLAWNSNPND